MRVSVHKQSASCSQLGIVGVINKGIIDARHQESGIGQFLGTSPRR